MAAAVGVEPTNAWFRARCLGPLGDAASLANRAGSNPSDQIEVWVGFGGSGVDSNAQGRCCGSHRFQDGHRCQSVCASIIGGRCADRTRASLLMTTRSLSRGVPCHSATYRVLNCEARLVSGTGAGSTEINIASARLPTRKLHIRGSIWPRRHVKTSNSTAPRSPSAKAMKTSVLSERQHPSTV